ncbi:MAG: YgjV family protein [Roseateles sp.]
MPITDWFSPAQLFGYVAFVLGVGCFLQTDDRRFKWFMTGECVAYIVHFALLGNPTAVASSSLSMLRSLLSLYTRSVWVAVVIVAANIGFGLAIADKPSDWLPLTASCLGTLALFTLQGIPMRLLMLVGTGLWIANNLIVGSIGGTALEIVIAAINISTIARMAREARAMRSADQRLVE